MKRIVTLALVLLMMTVLLTGCDSTKEFAFENLTMTVPSNLDEATGESQYAGYTFALDNNTTIVLGTKENLKTSAPTLDDYTKLVILANDYQDNCFTSKGDYNYYEYNKMIEGESYHYMIGLFDDGSAYWMIQFGAPTNKYEQSTAFEILDSVKFS